MSYIIELLSNQRFHEIHKNFIGHQTYQFKSKSLRNLELKIKNHVSLQNPLEIDSFYQFIFSNNSFTVNYPIQTFNGQISAIATFSFNIEVNKVESRIKLINKDLTYTLINSKQRRKFVSRILSFYLNSYVFFSEFKICINSHNGQIIIQSPTLQIINYDQRLLQIYFLVFHRLINHYLKITQQQIFSFFQMSNEVPSLYSLKMMRKNMNDKNWNNICRYIKISSTNLYYQNQNNIQSKIKQLKLNQEISFKKFKNNIITFEKNIKSMNLYGINPEQIDNPNFNNQFKILDYQKKNLIKKIQLPLSVQSKELTDNHYVMNFIKRKKQILRQPLNMRKIGLGGFASIWEIQLQFHYVASHKLDLKPQSWQITSQLFKKKLAVKKQDLNMLKLGIKSRIVHQKTILSKMKFCSNIYLPKFYIISDKNDDLHQDLIMDYIKYPTLGQYLRGSKQTSSIFTKMALILHIAQGLRMLKQYNIVHLDIKPSNIMLSKGNMIKLIDFGQSYHPQIINHRPGLSMPFSAPQNYKNSNFSEKNDVFSLGVIIYMMITGEKMPYYIYSERDRQQVYKNENSFYDRWFFCIEECNYYGKTSMMILLHSIIVRLMNKNPDDRSDLEWISILMSQISDCFR